MANGISLDEAIQEIAITLDKLTERNKNEIQKVVDAKLYGSTSPFDSPRPPGFSRARFLIPIILCVALGFIGTKHANLPDQGLKAEHLFGLLAFVVALASYLATTIREIIRNIATTHDLLFSRNSISYIAGAEASLLMFGVLVILRLFVNLSGAIDVFANKFIMCYLSITLLYLVGLHVRVWALKLWK
jgi:hypothetical protein